MMELPQPGSTIVKQYICSKCGSPVADIPAIANAVFDRAKQCGGAPPGHPCAAKKMLRLTRQYE
jgi:hypothetical protein